jgi:hypothetical protein
MGRKGSEGSLTVWLPFQNGRLTWVEITGPDGLWQPSDGDWLRGVRPHPRDGDSDADQHHERGDTR